MKLTTLLLTLTLSMASLGNECGNFILPSKFKLVEKVLTLTGGIKIQSDDRRQDLGSLNKKIFSFKDTYALKNAAGETQYTAAQRWFSWGLSLDIKNCTGKHVGRVKMQNFLLNLVTSDAVAVYTIYDANDVAIAQSERVSILSTKYSFYSLGDDRKVLATLDRSFIGGIFNDVWSVEIKRPDLLDSNVILFMAAFKTYTDNEKASSDSKANSHN